MGHTKQHILVTAIILAILVLFAIHIFFFPMYVPNNSKPRYIKLYQYEQALCHRAVSRKYEKSVCPKFGIVSVIQGGRLGNQIWEYASVWAIARRTGLEPYIPRCISKTLNQYFEHLSIPCLSKISGCNINGDQIVHSLADWNSTEQNIILPKYSALFSIILTWIDDLRYEFKFKKKYRNHAQILLKNAVAHHNISDPIFISVHIRRTDYMEYIRLKTKSEPASVDFYQNSMNHFSAKYSNAIFIIVSDDIIWCRKNVPIYKLRTHFVINNNTDAIGNDLAILCSCNHSIIDYGTYGTFGALIAGGETIVFNITKQLSTSIAQILPSWKIMN